MKLLFIAFADPKHGMGHFARTRAVITEAQESSYKTYFATNQHCPYPYFPLQTLDDRPVFEDILDHTRPDWVILDILDPHPAWLIELCHSHRVRVALLSGVGREADLRGADLAWSQDTPDKAILRRDIRALRPHGGERTFVWGGASDVLGLCERYLRLVDTPAWVVTTKYAPALTLGPRVGQTVLTAIGSSSGIFEPMQKCNRAVVHVGMMCWELAYLKVPMVMFSSDEGHLRDAEKFQQLEYGIAYPETGLPKGDAFVEFVSRAVTFAGQAPDGLGARRFLGALRS